MAGLIFGGGGGCIRNGMRVSKYGGLIHGRAYILRPYIREGLYSKVYDILFKLLKS